MAQKLSNADRRAQLLETAQAIVREQGTDALTLGALAERAGVSKPIAYRHFETRSGLMIALYKEINERQSIALDDALKNTPARLPDVAQVIARSFMDCVIAVGPEFHAIAAAQKGDAQMNAYQRELIEHYALSFCAVLTPLTSLPKETVRRRAFGIVGAADALSVEMMRGAISKDEAAADLAQLIVSWLSPERNPG
ncbi:TetR/AcrR family transcriptional regulator [Nordella sp. HKS 07]|nr:TetR/AcrR family transcriptional regulator [Nordella sp. HKS 07]